MNFRKIGKALGIPTAAIGIALLASSCRPMVTPEQLQTLKSQREQKASLTEQIAAQKKEASKIKSEIGARKAELKKCQEDSDFIKQKLSQWPNVWPDYNPQAKESEGEEKK